MKGDYSPLSACIPYVLHTPNDYRKEFLEEAL